jgi:hypothetical protein
MSANERDGMNKATEIFSEVPRTHNCAQAVAAGTGHEELSAELAACGGGRAPGGMCGALYAALRVTPESAHEGIKKAFEAAVGSTLCRQIKGVCHTPCEKCVETAADLAEKALRH